MKKTSAKEIKEWRSTEQGITRKEYKEIEGKNKGRENKLKNRKLSGKVEETGEDANICKRKGYRA